MRGLVTLVMHVLLFPPLQPVSSSSLLVLYFLMDVPDWSLVFMLSKHEVLQNILSKPPAP